ncbi:dehydrodolichyl diphosphate synthase 6-like [Cornus florida]|uniref:dehydrodolichyl diphosphate synthase 6-like n=1 Tax=Cornus florida TaxID=4283 RepID=UPI0028A297D3|nr:dehydrodolichyl diphosphate synthase 6-like [Cornus florida]XP_059642714.1 dehydrodolichyl diphosphate synthase 6-like [Cornus florida]
MGGDSDATVNKLFGSFGSFMRRILFNILAMGPIPNHIAFIMDGNRRYAKKQNLKEGAGHKAGYSALMSMLKYCYELEVKYITIYAFSIDNFKRRPEEVQDVMDLMQEKIEGLVKEESIVNQYGVRVYFIGNLKLMNEPVRVAAEKAMRATANNTRAVLLICVAYTSSDEIVHAVQQSCQDQEAIQASNGVINEEKQEKHHAIKLVDLGKHMYMSVAPDPDILIRTSGETRLSNFLLWQTTNCLLCCPSVLWPEISLWHLVQAVLNFQRHHSYLEKKKKQL